MQAKDILHFWFEELTEKQRFAKDAALDEMIRTRFGQTLEAATRCELFAWRFSLQGELFEGVSPEGALAEIIVLDQFSRNIFRGTQRAFAQDGLALALAQMLVASGKDQLLNIVQRRFAYMPYMHSESPLIHVEAVRLFAHAGLENGLDFELRHQAMITRFGRYPHRNAILGRVSNAEELAFLSEPGSSF